jgi:hypothetical protein
MLINCKDGRGKLLWSLIMYCIIIRLEALRKIAKSDLRIEDRTQNSQNTKPDVLLYSVYLWSSFILKE